MMFNNENSGRCQPILTEREYTQVPIEGTSYTKLRGIYISIYSVEQKNILMSFEDGIIIVQ